jgi:hypothetical protein
MGVSSVKPREGRNTRSTPEREPSGGYSFVFASFEVLAIA